ncbi:MAG: hypothetical protein PHN64_05035 [Desulfovibrionaceae bacterium]|nr:hypothetical protein [Desulfovibrionaceae bacterium]
MAQLQENIQIDSFRALSTQWGNITHTDAGLVHGRGLTWFRSAFNVQNARQDNVRTLNTLRQAIAQDDRYALVAGQVEAKLGRINTHYPLSARSVKNILNTLDSAVETRVQTNKNLTQSTLVNCLSQERVHDILENLKIVTPDIENFETYFTQEKQQQFISVMKARILAQQGDFLQPPSNEDIKNQINNTLHDIYAIYSELKNSPIEQNIKNDIFISIFKNNTIDTSEAIHNEIEKQEHILHNTTLIDEQVTTDGIKIIFQELLKTSPVPDALPTEEGLQNIQKRIKDILTKKDSFTTSDFTFEEITKILQIVAQSYRVGIEESARLEGNDAVFLKNLCQQIGLTAPHNYMEMLTTQAKKNTNLQLKEQLQKQNTIALFEHYIRNMVRNSAIKNAPLYIIRHSGVTPQQYYEHIAGLMKNAAQAQGQQAANIYSLLTEGVGAKVYAKMRLLQNEPATAEPFMLLTSLITNFGAAAGKSTAEIQATLEQAQLPELCRMDATIPLRTKENPWLAMERSKEELCKDFNSLILLEVAKEYMQGEYYTAFKKDFMRQQPVLLNGIPYPTKEERAVYLSSSATPEQKEQIFEQVRNHYTAFVSGNPDTTYETAPLEIKHKVNIITAFLNQETRKLSFDLLFKNTISRIDSNIPIAYLQKENSEDYRVYNEKNGDITLSIHVELPIKIIIETQNDATGPIKINERTSYQNFGVSFTLAEQSLTKLANQNWEEFSKRGHESIRNINHNDIPENLRIPFSNFSIDGMIEIHEKQTENEEIQVHDEIEAQDVQREHGNDVVQEQVI